MQSVQLSERMRRASRPIFQRLAINGANIAEGVRLPAVRESRRSVAVREVLTPANCRAVQHVRFNKPIGLSMAVPEEAVWVIVAPLYEAIITAEKQS